MQQVQYIKLMGIDNQIVPLEYIHTYVSIEGYLANIEIIQKFVNNRSYPIQVYYTCPLPPQAIITNCNIAIDEILYQAVVLLNDQVSFSDVSLNEADKFLLWQTKSGLYHLNLGLIHPGQTIKINLYYSEILTFKREVIRFRLPLRLDEQYQKTCKFNQKSEQDIQYEKTHYCFFVQIHIKGFLKQAEWYCPSHTAILTDDSKVSRIFAIDEAESYRFPDRDFILVFVPGLEKAYSILLGKDYLDKSLESPVNTLLLNFTPHLKEVNPSIAYQSSSLVIVIDCSTFLAHALEDIRKGLFTILHRLKSSDYFNIILFVEKYSLVFNELVPADETHIHQAKLAIQKLQSLYGESNVMHALNAASNFGVDILLITGKQGQLTEEMIKSIQNLPEKVFSIGIDVDTETEKLLYRLADVSYGHAVIITPGELIARRIEEQAMRLFKIPEIIHYQLDYPQQPISDYPLKFEPAIFIGETYTFFARFYEKLAGNITITWYFDETNKQIFTLNLPAVAESIPEQPDLIARLVAYQRLMQLDFSDNRNKIAKILHPIAEIHTLARELGLNSIEKLMESLINFLPRLQFKDKSYAQELLQTFYKVFDNLLVVLEKEKHITPDRLLLAIQQQLLLYPTFVANHEFKYLEPQLLESSVVDDALVEQAIENILELQDDLYHWEYKEYNTLETMMELLHYLHSIKEGAEAAHYSLLENLVIAFETLLAHLQDSTLPLKDILYELFDKTLQGIDFLIVILKDSLQGSRQLPSKDHGIDELQRSLEKYSISLVSSEAHIAAKLCPKDIQANTEVFDMFLEEAQETLLQSKRDLARWRAHLLSQSPLKDLERHIVTIKGGARIVGLPVIAELARALETMITNFTRRHEKPTSDAFQLIENGFELIHKLVNIIQQDSKRFYAHKAQTKYVDTLDKIQKNLPDKPTLEKFLNKSEGLLSEIKKLLYSHEDKLEQVTTYQALERYLIALKGHAAAAGLVNIAEFAQALEMIILNFSYGLQSPNLQSVFLVRNAFDLIASMIYTLQHTQQTDNESASALLSETFAENIPEDLTILEIFLTESEERIEESRKVFKSWLNNPATLNYANSLYRHVHTLKGGARLCRVNILGDFLYALERLLQNVYINHITPSSDMFRLIQNAFEMIEDMLISLKEKKKLSSNQAILNMQKCLWLYIEGEVDVFDESIIWKNKALLKILKEKDVLNRLKNSALTLYTIVGLQNIFVKLKHYSLYQLDDLIFAMQDFLIKKPKHLYQWLYKGYHSLYQMLSILRSDHVLEANAEWFILKEYFKHYPEESHINKMSLVVIPMPDIPMSNPKYFLKQARYLFTEFKKLFEAWKIQDSARQVALDYQLIHEDTYYILTQRGVLGTSVIISDETIQLPDLTIPHPIIELQEQILSSSKKIPTILVVDDSATVRYLMETFFKKYNMHMLIAEDGQKGVDILKTTLPDLVITDTEMPHISGFELIQYIRDHAVLSAIPVIMISGLDAKGYRKHAMEVKANRFLMKPYKEEKLLEEIQYLLKHPQSFFFDTTFDNIGESKQGSDAIMFTLVAKISQYCELPKNWLQLTHLFPEKAYLLLQYASTFQRKFCSRKVSEADVVIAFLVYLYIALKEQLKPEVNKAYLEILRQHAEYDEIYHAMIQVVNKLNMKNLLDIFL